MSKSFNEIEREIQLLEERRSQLLEYRKQLNSLSPEETIQRDLYLRGLANGEIQGPMTGFPELDKPWLKYYKKENIDYNEINMSCYRYLYEENKNHLNDVAIQFMNKNITYKELFRKIEKNAKALKEMGIQKGDIVTICLPNTPESAYLFYACSKIGAIADFIDPRENEEGLEKYLNISNPKHLIMLDLCFDNFKNLFEKKKIKNVVITSPIETLPVPIRTAYNIKKNIDNYSEEKAKRDFMRKSSTRFCSYQEFIQNGSSYTLETEEIYEKDCPVAIVHTGGTTGTPKGVLLSNDNLNELTNQAKHSDLKFIRHKKLMGVMPEFVGYGLSVGLHTSLVCGLKTRMILKYEPEKIPELILKYKPNMMAGSPGHWEIISKNKQMNDEKTDLSFFDGPIEGGDSLSISLETAINNLLISHNAPSKIQKGYGLTEKCSAATVCFNNEVNKLGSVGVPLSKTNICIYDDKNKQNLRFNEEGEICIAGPDIMMEYYGNQEETEKVIKKHEDGQYWLHTGDLGYVDEDGVLFVTGRKKDIIIRYDGIKIYPSNLKQTTMKNPFVEEFVLVGIDDPNHANGEIPIAFVQMKEEFKDEKYKQSVIDFIATRGQDFAIPVDYYFVDEYPRTIVGKIDKKELKRVASEKYQTPEHKSLQKSKK